MLTDREQHRLALLVPKLSNAEMHRYLPTRTYKADPTMASPEQVAANLDEVTTPLLASFAWHQKMVASLPRMAVMKLMANLSRPQWAMINAGYLLTFETALPALPEGELYELNVALKDHVKSLDDLAVGTPFPAGRVLKNAAGESYVE